MSARAITRPTPQLPVAAAFDLDVAGHALGVGLRPATPAGAFRRRTLLAGLVVVIILAAAVAVGMLATSGLNVGAAPGTAPAVNAPPVRDANWDRTHHGLAAAPVGVAPSIYYSAASAVSGIHGPAVVPAPSIYYSASSAAAGIDGPQAAISDPRVRGDGKALPGV